MADSRETRQQELARLLLQKARQDLDLVVSVADSEAVADEIIGFHIQQAIEKATSCRIMCLAKKRTKISGINGFFVDFIRESVNPAHFVLNQSTMMPSYNRLST